MRAQALVPHTDRFTWSPGEADSRTRTGADAAPLPVEATTSKHPAARKVA